MPLCLILKLQWEGRPLQKTLIKQQQFQTNDAGVGAGVGVGVGVGVGFGVGVAKPSKN